MTEAPDAPGTQDRPPQVTYAGWAIVVGSVALIVSAFQQISTLHTLDTRSTVEHLIRDQPSGLGFTVAGWLTALKVLGMISGACSAAGAILGWQALQRSRPARIVLLVLAVPLVVAGLATGPLFALLVLVGVVVLWLPTANAWFDPRPRERMQVMSDVPPPSPQDPSGQPPQAGGEPDPRPGEQQSQPPAEQQGQPPAEQPPVPPPYGQPYGQPTGQPSGQPSGQTPYGQTGPYGQVPGYDTPAPSNPYAAQSPGNPYAPYGGLPVDPHARPGSVTAAAIITFVLAGLSVLGGLVMLVASAATDDFYRTLSDDGYDLHGVTADELRSGLVAVGVVVTVLGLVAILAAVFVLRRSRAARVTLTVLAGLTIALSLVGITAVLPITTLVGAIATIVLLFGRRSNDWFARRGTQPPYPGASGSWPPPMP